VRIGFVGKLRRHVGAGSLPVCHQLFVDQFAGLQVEHPQALFGRGFRVIDHRQRAGIGDIARTHGTAGRAERHLQHIHLDRADGAGVKIVDGEVYGRGGSDGFWSQHRSGAEEQSGNDRFSQQHVCEMPF
jgi:hypothetical protein